MRVIQRFLILIAVAMLPFAGAGTADAFWGFGGAGKPDKSGLDLEQGYDRNTVVKLSGTVAAPPHPFAGDLIAFDLNPAGERMIVVLGPAWYLQDDNLDWKIGDRVTVHGSVARGKDGQTYLLTRQITTPGGTTIELRAENGIPNWSGGFHAGQRGGGVPGGSPQRGGGAGGRRGR
jgi:hypothetical protein